jgi:hypothetical protein
MNINTMNADTKIYYSSVNWDGAEANTFWTETYNEVGPGGKFVIDLARRINPNRFSTRDSSEWSLPWPDEILPKYKLIQYDSTYTGTFSEASDSQAMDYARRIDENNEKFAIMYSGGIDSTIITTALIKNLTKEQLKNVAICTSVQAVVENPNYWRKFIFGKFKIIDSMINKYDMLLEQGYTPVTADDGDCIHGTVLGLNFYHAWEQKIGHKLTAEQRTHVRNNLHKLSDKDTHFSVFEDALVAYFQYGDTSLFPIPTNPNPDPMFGRKLYDKYALNAKTASCPVISLHDFFWWLIFNVKMINCGVRGAMYYNDRYDMEKAINKIENWYLWPAYQQWSMNNNNNGQKIGFGAGTYKKVARDYIYELDNNVWYRDFKLKLESMGQNSVRQTVITDVYPKPSHRFGITTDYTMLDIMDPMVQYYVRHHLSNFKITWSEETT